MIFSALNLILSLIFGAISVGGYLYLIQNEREFQTAIFIFIIGSLLALLGLAYYNSEKIINKLRNRNKKLRELVENLLEQQNPQINTTKPALTMPSGLITDKNSMTDSGKNIQEFNSDLFNFSESQNANILRGKPPITNNSHDQNSVMNDIKRDVEKARDNQLTNLNNMDNGNKIRPTIEKAMEQRDEIGMIKRFFNQISDKLKNIPDHTNNEKPEPIGLKISPTTQNSANNSANNTMPTMVLNQSIPKPLSSNSQLYLQNIVDINRQIIQYQACYGAMLGADGKILNPKSFLPELIESGQLGTFELRLLEQIIRHKNSQSSHNPPYIHHLSTETLQDSLFLDELIEYLSDIILTDRTPRLAKNVIFSYKFSDINIIPVTFLNKMINLDFHFCQEGGRIQNIDTTNITNRAIKLIRLDFNDFQAQIQSGTKDEIIRAKNRLEQQNIELIINGIATQDALNIAQNHEIILGQGGLFDKPRPVS